MICEDISKSMIKKITHGISSSNILQFVLIGQLGKFISEHETSSISSVEILDFAFEIIRESDNLIPCGFALIECIDDIKVQKIYIDYGFKYLKQDREYFQFYKKI